MQSLINLPDSINGRLEITINRQDLILFGVVLGIALLVSISAGTAIGNAVR